MPSGLDRRDPSEIKKKKKKNTQQEQGIDDRVGEAVGNDLLLP